MTGTRNAFLAAGALATIFLAAAPAAAFDPRYDTQSRPYSSDLYSQAPYADRGSPRDAEDEVGSVVVAVCPPGYDLGPNGRLCWPE